MQVEIAYPAVPSFAWVALRFSTKNIIPLAQVVKSKSSPHALAGSGDYTWALRRVTAWTSPWGTRGPWATSCCKNEVCESGFQVRMFVAGSFRVSQSAFRNDRTFMNFSVSGLCRIAAASGQCWRRCVSGFCSREPRRSRREKNLSNRDDFPMPGCSLHWNMLQSIQSSSGSYDFQEHVSRQSVFVTWCDSAKECLVAELRA